MPIDQSPLVPRAVAELSPSTSYNGNDHDTSLESLCESCRSIDWSNITDWENFKETESSTACPNGPHAKPVRAFKEKSRSQLLNSNCRVCRLVGSLINPNSGNRTLDRSLEFSDQPLNVCLEADKDLTETRDSEERAPYVKLAVRSPGNGLTSIYGREYTTTLNDDDKDYIRFIIAHKFRNNETAGIRTLEPLKVNFDFVRRILHKCLDDHEECRSTKVEVAGLRVIEVTTKTIHQAPPDFEYIALSYVWGDNSACKSAQGEFPPVVQDAFTVTEVLGYRYLWVDRYCIEQNPNSPHMQSMINQMDLVYSNARATIVAASGSSASDGLPGISVPRYQAYVDIGETHLVEVSDVEADVLLSDWATRGWIYQEWYFSKRRLIFTDKEVVFLCNKEMEKETVLDIELCGIDDPAYLYSPMKPPDNLNDHQLPVDSLESSIEEYSKRNLSYDCDSLDAFAGILRYYQSNTVDVYRPMSHLWGIPLNMLGRFGEGQAFFNLLWNHEAIARRRDGLPSWSWSGWCGSVVYASSKLQIQPPTGERAASNWFENLVDKKEGVTSTVEGVLRIQIPIEDRTIDLNSFCQERRLSLHHKIHPKELRITSFIVPLRFRKVDGYQLRSHPEDEIIMPLTPKIVPTFLVRPGVFLGSPVSFDREYNFELHKLGLVLPCTGQFKDSDSYHIIVLHPVADGKYERAGLLNLRHHVHQGNITAWKFGILLDENDIPIPGGNYEYTNPRNEVLKKHLFLQGAEWKTICLI